MEQAEWITMLWEELVEEGKNGVHELDRLRKQQLLSVGDDNLRLRNELFRRERGDVGVEEETGCLSKLVVITVKDDVERANNWPPND